jgi:hypothetical protein
MADHIVGMMWNRNEGDIIAETIESALRHVDTLVIADDGSTDNSWDVIQGFAKRHKDQIEHIQRRPNKTDRGQKKSLLEVIKSRYRPEDTWVQVVESDIMIWETDLRRALKERSDEVSMIWTLLNAVIPPDLCWEALDEYPTWSKPITEIMTYSHRMEEMTYTFRPFEKLAYTAHFTPWPKGFSKVEHKCATKEMTEYTPLLAHFGYRGPTHMNTKADLAYVFDLHFSKYSFPLTRSGWMNSKGRRGIHDDKIWCEGVEGWRAPYQKGYEPL